MGPQVRVGLILDLWQTGSDLLGRLLGGTPLGTLPPVVSCGTWVNLPGNSAHRALHLEHRLHRALGWGVECGEKTLPSPCE